MTVSTSCLVHVCMDSFSRDYVLWERAILSSGPLEAMNVIIHVPNEHSYAQWGTPTLTWSAFSFQHASDNATSVQALSAMSVIKDMTSELGTYAEVSL